MLRSVTAADPLLESGIAGATALAAAPHPALAVPATLHASLIARLDRLGPAAKDVAQKGAAIGREFCYELLASIVDQSAPELRKALHRLTSSGLLFVRGTPPQSTYLFKHALVQDVAFETPDLIDARALLDELHRAVGVRGAAG